MSGRRIFFALLVVVLSLPVLATWVLSWMGRREWEATRQELAAKGEKLTMAELVPGPVADEVNFFGDPMWKEIAERRPKPLSEGYSEPVPAVPKGKQQLEVFNEKIPPGEVAELKKAWPQLAEADFDQGRQSLLRQMTVKFKKADPAWRKDCAEFSLAALKPVEPLMEKVAGLLERPEARFPLEDEDGINVCLPHLTRLLPLGQVFMIKARSEIELGQGAAAARDIHTMIALSRTLRDDRVLISYLVRVSLTGMFLAVIHEGIEKHVWTEGELAKLEEELRKEHLLPGLLYALRGERGGLNAMLEGFHHGMYGAFEQMQVVVREMTGEKEEDKLTAALGGLGMRLYIPVLSRFDQASENRLVQGMLDTATAKGWKGMNTEAAFRAPAEFGDTLYALAHPLTVKVFPPLAGVLEKGAMAQDKLVQGRIALALERYYLKHKEYPETLEALGPEYLREVPVEVLTGEPMHYKRTAPGTFLLWAGGWDGKDDGGQPVPLGKRKGDWVWGKT